MKSRNMWNLTVLLILLSLVCIPAFAQEKMSQDDVQKAMENAEKKLRDGKPSEAAMEYERIVTDYPDNGDAQIRLARIYRDTQEWEKAGTAFQKAAENLSGPDQAEAYEGLTEALVNRANYPEAAKQGRKAIELNPTSVAATSAFAFSLVKTGAVEEGATAARKAIELDANSAAAQAILGEVFLAQGNLAEAESTFRKAVGMDDKCSEAHAGLAALLLANEDLDGAVASATRALELNDKLSRAYATRGVAKGLKEGTNAAYPDLSMATTVNPSDPDAQFAFAQVYHRDGNKSMAVNYYRKALDYNSSLSGAYLGLGDILIGQRKYDEALEVMTKAVEVLPNSAKAHGFLGICLDGKQQADAALAEFDQAIELDDSLALAHHGRGKVLLARQDLTNALSSLEKAIGAEPDNIDFLTTYGGYFVAVKDFDKAIEALSKAAAGADYYEPAGLYNLGFAHLNKQNYEDAAAAFQRAVDSYPAWGTPHAGLGWAYFGMIKPGCPCGPEDEERVLKIQDHYQKALDAGVTDADLKSRIDTLAKGEKVK